MLEFDSHLNPVNPYRFDEETISYAMHFLLLASILTTLYRVGNNLGNRIGTFLESKNRFHYEDPAARMMAGFLTLIAWYHTVNQDLKIDGKGKLYGCGPHRTKIDALGAAKNFKDTPLRIFATDGFNYIPGVERFLTMFQVIPVKANAPKINGQSANAQALVQASEILKKKGCVFMFPQGGFSRVGEEALKIFDGIIELAMMNQIPIEVLRIDGFPSLKNGLPRSIINNTLYRVFGTALLPNKIRTKECGPLDFHLRSENAHLSDEEKKRELRAQLYAYYRHTQDLTDQQIEVIKTEIEAGTHLEIWDNKVKQYDIEKQLTALKKATPANQHSMWNPKAKQVELEKQLKELKEEAMRLGEATLKAMAQASM